MRGKKAPSKKQLIAIQLIAKGNSPTQAMRQAGYAETTLRNPKNNLLKLEGVLTAIEKLDLVLEEEGITIEYLGQKLARYLKEGNSNQFFQAYDRIKEAKRLTGEPPVQKKKREVTFTEWINPQEEQ